MLFIEEVFDEVDGQEYMMVDSGWKEIEDGEFVDKVKVYGEKELLIIVQFKC